MRIEYRSIQDSLIRLTDDLVGLNLIADLPEAIIKEVAQELFNRNIYNCRDVASSALELLPGLDRVEALARAHVEHVLWCTWITARRLRSKQFAGPQWRAYGLEFLKEVAHVPTVFIAPMTLPFVIIADAIARSFSDREVVFYGEGLRNSAPGSEFPSNFIVLGQGGRADARTIISVLQRRGIFCTYPDFVYTGHSFLVGDLFGVPRRFSRSFISICTQLNVHLLPASLWRENESIVARLEEPLVFEASERLQNDTLLEVGLQTIGALLERSIMRKPEQWLLLETLVVEAANTIEQSNSTKTGSV